MTLNIFHVRGTMSETEMKVDPARAKALISQLQAVKERIAVVAKGRSVSHASRSGLDSGETPLSNVHIFRSWAD